MASPATGPDSQNLSHPTNPNAEIATSSNMSSNEVLATSMQNPAHRYLQTLLGSTLRLYTSDGRMFIGEFKCTDKDRNIILARAHEYRAPSNKSVAAAAANAGTLAAGASGTMKLDMTSRFMGLIVVPGQHILRIEVEDR